MRQNSVMIKSCAYGLSIYLDPDLEFSILLDDVADKFREAARFFRNAQMAVSFKGRSLSSEEEMAVISAITQNSRINIVCLVDESRQSADYYKEAVVRALEQQSQDRASIWHGTLRSGQKVESENSILILGDVNPGASVTADGSVVILGCCMGQVTAGFTGREDVFAAALVLKPSLLRLAGRTARSAIHKSVDNGEYSNDPMIAYLRDDHITMEKLNGSVFALIEELQRGDRNVPTI